MLEASNLSSSGLSHTAPPVNPDTVALFNALHGRFNDNIVRELVLASAGLKLSRTCMYDEDLAYFLPLAERYGLAVALSDVKFLHRPDQGKGGWSNAIEREVPLTDPAGQFNVYCASSKQIAAMGLTLEEASAQDEFGLLLSIPDCCRVAYLRFHPIAARKQNDFVPLVLDNTASDPPYNYWVNYVTQYFGRALLSFFPCSFTCTRAAAFAQLTFDVLRQCSAAWAESFLTLQQSTVLYTEYLGLHLLPRARVVAGWVDYQPEAVVSTTDSEVATLLRCGNRLRLRSKHHVDIFRDQHPVEQVAGEDVSVCCFT